MLIIPALIPAWETEAGGKESKASLCNMERPCLKRVINKRNQCFSRAMLLLEILGKSVPCQLLVLLTFLGLWPYHSKPCLHLHMNFSSVCVIFLYLIKTLVMTFRICLSNPRLFPYAKILNLIIATKTLFCIREHLQILGMSVADH
jgi:hypothetical protein